MVTELNRKNDKSAEINLTMQLISGILKSSDGPGLVLISLSFLLLISKFTDWRYLARRTK